MQFATSSNHDSLCFGIHVFPCAMGFSYARRACLQKRTQNEPQACRNEQCLATICGREVELSVVMQQIFHTPFRLVGVDFALVFPSFHTHLRKARRTYHSQIRSMQVFCKVHIRALTFPQRIRASRSNELCICTCAHKSCKRRCGCWSRFCSKQTFVQLCGCACTALRQSLVLSF